MMRELINLFEEDVYAPVSFDLGFNIKRIKLELPDSHAIWDKMASELADHIGTFRVKELLLDMPVLHADSKTLSADYLLRASIIVSGFAHAFYYPEGYSESLPLPDSVLIPLLEIANRIDKKLTDTSNPEKSEKLYVGRTYLEDFLGNWAFDLKDESEQKITLDKLHIDNLKLLVPYFSNQEEYVSTIITGPLMQAKFAPAIKSISGIQDELDDLKPNTDIIINHLIEITNSIKDVRKSFMLMTPKLGSPYYVDQIIWPQTSPTIGKKSHPNEMPNTGVDSPIFHIMDKLLNRVSYESKMGKNIEARFNAVVSNHQKIILAVTNVGSKLFEFIKKSQNKKLNDVFADLVLCYAGPSGLLDAHRKKAYGYLKMSFLSGRLSTNGNETGKSNTTENKVTGLTPWGMLNISFLKGMEDRVDVLNRLGIDYKSKVETEPTISVASDNLKRFKRYQVTAMCSDSKLVAIYRGNVFDLTSIAKTHPGGHRILSSLSGTDMTTELEQAHHFNLNAITLSLRAYHLGEIENSEPSTPMYQTVHDWTKTVFLITAVQNNIKNIWLFDKNEIGDRNRYMPFQFVMKTIDIIFGRDGYFDSLLESVDGDLVSKYRERALKFIKDTRNGDERPIKFIEIGKFVRELGLQEIKNRALTKVSETEVNKLNVYKTYNQLINESLHCLESLKIDIITQLDECTSIGDLVPEQYNKKMKELVFNKINDLISKIDSPQTLKQPETNHHFISPLFLLNTSSSLDASILVGAVALISLLVYITSKDNDYLRYSAGSIFIASMGTLALRNCFFSNNENAYGGDKRENTIEFSHRPN